jgi:hypothetical protein
MFPFLPKSVVLESDQQLEIYTFSASQYNLNLRGTGDGSAVCISVCLTPSAPHTFNRMKQPQKQQKSAHT